MKQIRDEGLVARRIDLVEKHKETMIVLTPLLEEKCSNKKRLNSILGFDSKEAFSSLDNIRKSFQNYLKIAKNGSMDCYQFATVMKGKIDELANKDDITANCLVDYYIRGIYSVTVAQNLGIDKNEVFKRVITWFERQIEERAA